MNECDLIKQKLINWSNQRSFTIYDFSHFNLSQRVLNEKYFNTFNQHLINEINEILICKTTQIVVRFKDYLFYDDENEFIDKYYNNQ